MSIENKTAADAPQMAHDALSGEYAGMPASSQCDIYDQRYQALEDIAGLPPAPLPADVVGLVKDARIAVFQIGNDRPTGYATLVRLAAIVLPGDPVMTLAQPAAPMTEAEQADEAGKRG